MARCITIQKEDEIMIKRESPDVYEVLVFRTIAKELKNRQMSLVYAFVVNRRMI